MTVFAYVRVSTTKQLEGDSLASQERQILGYCAMKGFDSPELVVEEGVSASIPMAKRPAAGPLLVKMQPGDVLVAAKLDRLFRSALDTLQSVEAFKQREIGLHLLDLGGDVTGGGLSKLMLTVTAGFAEMERDRIRERVLMAKHHGRLQGRHLGGSIPFGFVKTEDGFLMPDAEEQRGIEVIRRCGAAGDSTRRISAELKRQGITLSHMGVKNVLARLTNGPASG